MACVFAIKIVLFCSTLLLLHILWCDYASYKQSVKEAERLRVIQQRFAEIDKEFEEDWNKLDEQQKQPIDLRKDK